MKERFFISFKTFFVKDLWLVEHCWGLTHYSKHFILVDSEQTRIQQIYTLFHELVHALFYKIVPRKIGWKLDGLWDFLDLLLDVENFKENYRLVRENGYNLRTALEAYLERYEKRFLKFGYRRNLR